MNLLAFCMQAGHKHVHGHVVRCQVMWFVPVLCHLFVIYTIFSSIFALQTWQLCETFEIRSGSVSEAILRNVPYTFATWVEALRREV
jgi:hypothetical protein